MAATGELPRALDAIARARALDPLSRTIEVHVATISYWASRYDDAERQCREAIRFNPQFWYAHYQLGVVLEHGRPEEAVNEQRRAMECFREPSAQLSAALARACALTGAEDEGRRLLDEARGLGESRGSVCFHLAAACAALGDTNAAFEYLWKGIDEGEAWMAFTGVDPRLDGLRPDARFAPLLARLGVKESFGGARTRV